MGPTTPEFEGFPNGAYIRDNRDASRQRTRRRQNGADILNYIF